MIKELNTAYNRWAKIKVLKSFLYERPLYCIEGFLKIKENKKSRNVFSCCKVNDTINKSNVLPDKSTFKKAGLIVINKFRKYLLESISDKFGSQFVVTV